jgi:signal transduction histidine kinase
MDDRTALLLGSQERATQLIDTLRHLQRELDERTRTEARLHEENGLLRKLLELQECERKLIAFEIHDGFVQHAAGAKMLLDALRDPALDPATSQTLAQAIEAVGRGIVDARRVMSGLRPPGLDELGLCAALELLVREMRRQYDVEIDLRSSLNAVRLAPVLENGLFRIVQESLTNACRYSRSGRILVKVGRRCGRVHLVVRDWGQGFNPCEIASGRFGLQGIRERTKLLGGCVAIRTAPDRGTLIRAEFPVLRHAGDRTVAAD